MKKVRIIITICHYEISTNKYKGEKIFSLKQLTKIDLQMMMRISIIRLKKTKL